MAPSLIYYTHQVIAFMSINRCFIILSQKRLTVNWNYVAYSASHELYAD